MEKKTFYENFQLHLRRKKRNKTSILPSAILHAAKHDEQRKNDVK